ncbi:MAG: hypothetical protein A2X94_13645 [Bdellovibrionales bacterium GWB1_55_8]|nr:MAG: hypothetical protein A2X94_13645 [Bdellovibrionales bacterium GWB1_55_8]
MIFHSIRTQLTAFFVFIFGTTLVLLSGIGYRFFSETQQLDFDAALYNHTVDVASTISLNYFGNVSIPLTTPPAANKVFPFSLRRSYMQIRDTSGEVLASSSALSTESLPLSREGLEGLRQRGVSLTTLPGNAFRDRTSYRLLNYLVNRPPLPQMILQVAAPMTFLDRNKEQLRQFLYIAIPVVLLIATMGGFYLSRRALEPVSVMSAKADAIELNNLSERVPVPTEDNEVRQLALTLNRLLDRIETAVTANEKFVADASHQLKTPLSILRGELDLMIRKPRDEEETRAFLSSASQEINSLTAVVENLLILARVDAGLGSLEKSLVRMDELTMESISILHSPAKEKGIPLRLNLNESQNPNHASNFEAQGDPDLLKIAIQNLVENAIKYSAHEKPVEIELKEEPDFFAVRVTDSGPGIQSDQLPRLLDRFYRTPQKDRKTRGFGLGLPIANSIAKAHGGSIDIESTPGTGSVFTLRIKKV